MNLILRVGLFVMGAGLAGLAVRSAIRTFLLPRAAIDALARLTSHSLRVLFNLWMWPLKTYAQRDGVLAYYAPIGLLTLLVVWLGAVLVGYALMFSAVGEMGWGAALALSGSSLFTLGFEPVNTLPLKLLAFSEAALGPLLMALLIGYLPTLYGAFSRRETLVNLLEVRAGSPPSAVDLIVRFHRLHRLERIHEMWAAWEVWFAELAETHTSLAMLNFFRSPLPEHSWVTAAGAVLDGAALVVSTVDTPFNVQGPLCLRAGYIALRRIADFFGIAYNPDPRPDDPISISRAQYDRACAMLEEEGVPLQPDREATWRAFAGWRVNYDVVLLGVARLTNAPPAPWSSPDMPEQLRPPTLGRGA